jgi:CRISPR-associated protein Cas2
MPFTVITLKKVPNSLRGDLTRWMQEIATGVYVGSFNSKVREYLWKRVTDTVGQGEAAMCYSCRNEIGYSFCTCNTERQIVDYDGIPLVLIPTTGSSEYDNNNAIPHGFSSASNFQHAHKTVKPRASKDRTHLNDIVFLDIETSGLDADHDQIIEIGAVRLSGEHETEFHRMIQADTHLSDMIINLTGITDEMLKDGTRLEASLQDC